MRLVLLELSTWADADGGRCFPSQRSIADATGLSEKRCQRLLSIAERRGWLRSWLVSVPNSKVHRKHYALTIPAPDEPEQPRRAAGLIRRDSKGQFKASTPPTGTINPAHGDRTTPPQDGSTSPLLNQYTPKEEGIQEEVFLRRRVLELHRQGRDPASIAGLMWRHELPERLIREWIRGRPG
jgi:hypothetical protein